MKSFYFLSLMISALTITTNSYGMLAVLSRRKTIYSPAQRNFCIKQASLHQRIKMLEMRVIHLEKEVEALRWKDDFPDREIVDDSFIPQYNMHVPVREEKN